MGGKRESFRFLVIEPDNAAFLLDQKESLTKKKRPGRQEKKHMRKRSRPTLSADRGRNKTYIQKTSYQVSFEFFECAAVGAPREGKGLGLSEVSCKRPA